MDNENNKWEYDYSSLYRSGGAQPSGSYQNVGSSGSNTANQYDMPGGSYTPPQPPEEPARPRRKAGRVLRSALALVLAAAMGFAGGVVGSRFFGGPRVVLQSANRGEASSSAVSTSSSTAGSELSLSEVSALVSPSVVVITTEQVVYSSQWYWYGQGQVQSGAGSGVIISDDGYILTCAHVIEGASNITVTIGDTDYTAQVIGSDTVSDIAVIKIDATGLTPAAVGDSNSLVVGEAVVAVGNPLGTLGGTVTNGIISALNRSVSIQSGGSVVNMSLIQTNASVSPGNSGGGLFNMAGELIGIVNAKSSDADAEGLGFAIPINDAVEVAEDLLERGYVSGRPYLGITYLAVTDVNTAQQLGVSAYGVYIMEVVEGSPAAAAGLQPGDRVISVDNTEIAAQEDLGSVVQSHAAGDVLSITVARGGQMVTLSVTLGEQGAANASNS